VIIIRMRLSPELSANCSCRYRAGELQERQLQHREEAEKFYRDLAAQGMKVLVEMEASAAVVCLQFNRTRRNGAMVIHLEHARLKPLIILLFLAAFLCACDSLPSDQALIARFGQKRPELERLRRMIDEDDLKGRIHAHYADPKLSSSRLEKYRSLLRDAGVMRLSAHGKSEPFELIVAGTGLLAQDDYKGYMYNPVKPQPSPVPPSLDNSCFDTPQMSDGQRFCNVSRFLDGGWWLIRYEYR
jgi:hypothetical protein